MSYKLKVGDKVRVLNANGCGSYRKYIGQTMTVSYVGGGIYESSTDDGAYTVGCAGVTGVQYAHRFELVTELKQFGIDDLRPFMRVVCRNGEQGIIAENTHSMHNASKFIILYTSRDSFDYATFNGTGYTKECSIVEVYAAPDPYYMLMPTQRGALLYVNDEVEAEKKRAIEEAKAKAKAKAKALLDAAQAAYDALN